MNTLFTRYGAELKPTHTTDKGRPYALVARACGRCGGAGGADKWAHTGWTCFDCGGNGQHRNGPEQVKLYTAEELAKLDAAAAKRAAKKAAEAAAKAEQARLEAEARRATFMQAHGDLLERCKPYVERSSFVADVCRKASKHAELTPGQVDALEATIAKIAAEDARKAATTYIGQIGQRLRGIKATVQRVVTLESNGPYSRFFHIVTLRTDEGHTLVVKSSRFCPEQGEALTLDGTVKDHSVYNGERQTQLERVKA